MQGLREELYSVEVVTAVEKCLEKMPLIYRQVLAKRDEGYSYKEIAADLSRSPAACWNIMYRIRRRIRGTLVRLDRGF